MKKKENPKIRHHLTAAEKDWIRSLALAGCGNTQIARTLHVTRNTVALARQKMGLAARRKPVKILNQTEHLALMSAIMHQKSSAAALAREFGLPYARVLGLAHAYRVCQRFMTFSNPPLESYFASAPPPPMKQSEGVTHHAADD
jgi:hypothetical protein